MLEFQQKIGYQFKDLELLKQALSHPSYAVLHKIPSYERMEFFGDSILSFVISELLFNKFPNSPEGELAKRRSAIVCGENLSQIAIDINLNQEILLAFSEEKNGGRSNKANLENCFEALIAAIYFDSGITATHDFINRLFHNSLEKVKEVPRDPKTTLQEWAQSRALPIPNYNIIEQSGPAHAPIFTVEIKINNHIGTGTGSSKKIAERNAAQKILIELDNIVK